MSTTAPPPSVLPVATVPDRSEITVISHSNLFYWWPVWACGFLMALLTFIDGNLMTTVPSGSKAVKEVNNPLTGDKHEAILLPTGKHVQRVDPNDLSSQTSDPRVHMARSKAYGVIFCTVLLICIVITNVPLRGMWSVVVIITLILVTVILVLAGVWERIVTTLALLDVRINLGGYLFIAGVLFAIWLFTMLFFDRQIYIVFTPGQFKVCTEIGGGEKVYDTMGMSLERQRGDLFRHYILGLGSGDLIVKTSGAQAHHFDLPNVLFISKKVQQIEDMLRKRKVVEGR
jgi:hypothetical protein